MTSKRRSLINLSSLSYLCKSITIIALFNLGNNLTLYI